jgi:hypothetical protein
MNSTRKMVLSGTALAATLGLAGCAGHQAGLAGTAQLPALAAPSTAPSSTAPSTAGSASATAPTTRTDPTTRTTPTSPTRTSPLSQRAARPVAPRAYRTVTATFSVEPTGYASVGMTAPAGWSGPTALDGVVRGLRQATMDSRDRTGQLLLRLAWEPDTSYGTAAGLPINRYANLRGYELISYTHPLVRPNQTLAGGWEFFVVVDGKRRIVSVRSYLLDGVRVTVYASGPVRDRNLVAKIAHRAAAVQIHTYVGHQA